jgi:hypothetical protein
MKRFSMGYRVWVLIGGWVFLLIGGLIVVAEHQYQPGASGSIPTFCEDSRFRLRPVMFIHPHCPCTPAALHNFEELLAQTDTRGILYMVSDETNSPNFLLASKQLHIEVLQDRDGVEARKFGAETSGHVFLFGRDARLLFEGGITDGRGRSGDSLGKQAVIDRILGRASKMLSLPVFGCSL